MLQRYQANDTPYDFLKIKLYTCQFLKGAFLLTCHHLVKSFCFYILYMINYFWYFYVKNVILGLCNLFPCFQVHLILFFGQICFILWLGINQKLFQNIFSSMSSFMKPLNRLLTLYMFFFNSYSINKIQTFVFSFSGGFLALSPSRFKDPC